MPSVNGPHLPGRMLFFPEGGGVRFLRNIGTYAKLCTIISEKIINMCLFLDVI
jgi:hypothetical protein